MSDVRYIRLGEDSRTRPSAGLGGGGQRLGLPKPRRRHVFAGILALAFSSGVHYAAYEYMPDISYVVSEYQPPERQMDAVQVRDVVPEMPMNLPMQDPLSEHKDGEFQSITEAFESLTEFTDSLEAVVPDLIDPSDILPEIDMAALEPDTAEASPELEVMDTGIDARQEILAVEQPFFEEEITAIPRSFIPEIARVNDALDLVMPVEVLDDIGSLNGDGIGEIDFISPAARNPLPSLDLSTLAALQPPEIDFGSISMPELPDAPELIASDLSQERPEEITQLNAVENLLDVRVHLLNVAEDPRNQYFKIDIFRKAADVLPSMPKAVVLMQDCSESMTQAKLDQCKKGLDTWLKMLRPGDMFDVMSFSDKVDTCFGKFTPIDARSRSAGSWFIRNLKARGKTDVYASLEQLSRVYSDSPFPVIAILMTDGRPTMGMQDSSDIIEGFTQFNRGNLSVFSVGGGRQANKYLLDLLGYRNRGDSMVVPLDEGIPTALGELSRQLQRPILHQLQYSFTGDKNVEVYPRQLTNLYLDRPLQLYGRVPKGSEDVAVQIIGTSMGKKHDMVFPISFRDAIPATQDIRRAWAGQKMVHLVGDYIESRRPHILREMDGIGQRYRVPIPYMHSMRGTPAAQVNP